MNAPGDRAEIVTAVPRRRERILLCHRSPQLLVYPNVWDLPGGHIDPGETAEQALGRELTEELGICIDQPSDDPTADIATDPFHMRTRLIEARPGTPTNTALDEHDHVIWASLDQAHGLDLAPSRLLPAVGRSPQRSAWMPRSGRADVTSPFLSRGAAEFAGAPTPPNSGSATTWPPCSTAT